MANPESGSNGQKPEQQQQQGEQVRNQSENIVPVDEPSTVLPHDPLFLVEDELTKAIDILNNALKRPSDADAVSNAIRDALVPLGEMLAMIKATRQPAMRLEASKTSISDASYQLRHIYEAIETMMFKSGMAVDLSAVETIPSFINSFKDPKDRIFMFSLIMSHIIRFPPAYPIIMPYDPRCQLIDFELNESPATMPNELGFTWVAEAECPDANGGTKKHVFTGEVIYGYRDFGSPAHEASNAHYYYNYIHFGPVLPMTVTMDLGEGKARRKVKLRRKVIEPKKEEEKEE